MKYRECNKDDKRLQIFLLRSVQYNLILPLIVVEYLLHTYTKSFIKCTIIYSNTSLLDENSTQIMRSALCTTSFGPTSFSSKPFSPKSFGPKPFTQRHFAQRHLAQSHLPNVILPNVIWPMHDIRDISSM